MNTIIKYVNDTYNNNNKIFPKFRTGDTITIFYNIKEGDKNRIQFFKGIVIKLQGHGNNKSFTIRKMSGDIGIERIFILSQPIINKIQIDKKGKVRRSRIYYFSKLKGKKAKIKEKKLKKII